MKVSLRALLAAAMIASPAWAQGAARGSGDSGPIDPGALSAEVKILASDAYEGRAPGTPGEAMTLAHLVSRVKRLGLEPAGDEGGYLQTVPLIRTQVLPDASLSVRVSGAVTPLVQSEDIYVNTVRPVDQVSIKDAPMVFVGYGAHAPERGWDDFKDVDLHGKIAVFLVNDPDFEAAPGEPVAGLFGGKAMTLFGRWTYKYEEAGRRGALGAIIVHETPGAGYGWVTVVAPKGENFDVVRPSGGLDRPLLQGWLQRAKAVELFKSAGLDFDALKVRARSASFHPVVLEGVKFSADLKVAHETVTSHNVLAKITGAVRPAETVMFSAHWDAYGVAPRPDGGPKVIRPGANDDGLGVAGVLELAHAFKAERPTERTLVFALWTGEERGLLGSEYFAEHPTIALQTLAADYTIDILQTAGLSRNVVLIGAGQNELEADLAAAAQTQGRTVVADAHPERGLFYRADHFSLAKRGVPVLLLMGIGGGPDLKIGGQAAGDQWVNDYTAHCYHQACDAWSANWDLSGAAQDVDLLYLSGKALADSTRWPNWNKDSEFRSRRDESAGSRP